ncbi:hypothetical protein [Neoactinobaculum massilliense]|uniref:hypothetical protein n=1 Tax=Neoactinobaculum massilliense TaxID=2364794 RepID=UPI0013DDE332|nr:hypothetical protein [Neoactinobaculum massilliense]
MEYTAATGEHFTDEDIERWAADAESGFPDSTVEWVPGRPWGKQTEPMVVKTIRIPAALWHRIEQQASKRGVTVSEVVCEKLRA